MKSRKGKALVSLFLALSLCLCFLLTGCQTTPAPDTQPSGSVAQGSTSATEEASGGSTATSGGSVLLPSGTPSGLSSGTAIPAGSVTKPSGNKTTIPGKTSATSAGTKQSRQPDTDTAALTAMKKALNFGGKELVIMYEWEPCTDKGYGVSAYNDLEIKRIEELQKKYNVKLTLKKCATNPYNQTVMTSIMSGKPSANIYFIGPHSIPAFVKARLLSDLTDAMKQTGITLDASYYNALGTSINKLNGRQYAMGAGVRLGCFVMYNKTIFQSLKMEDPQDLMKKGTWTWSKVTELAKKATVKDSSGAVTRYGLGFTYYIQNVAGLVNANNGKFIGVDANGKLKNTLNSKQVRETFDQIAKWCSVDKIATVNYGQKAWNALDQDFFNGKIAMIFAQPYDVEEAIYKMSDDFGVAYIPKGPSSKGYLSYVFEDYGYIVPITYQNQAKNYLMLLDDLCKPLSKNDFKSEWISRFQDSKSYNIFKEMMDGTLRQTTDHFMKVNIDTADITGLHDGTKTSAGIIGKYESMWNTTLKDNFSHVKFEAIP